MANRKRKGVREHSADLANLLIYSIEHQSTPIEIDDAEHVAHLLLLSAGIEEVNFDRTQFNPNNGWCSAGDRFDDYQDRFEQRLVNSLTKFLFIWSSCEAAVNLLVPDETEDAPNGKINRLCAFLKREYEPRNVSQEYKDCLSELNKLAANAPTSTFATRLKLRKTAPHIGVSGYGISSVYSIRNSLSHGALSIPLTQQENEGYLDAQLIDCCSSIVNHSLQMLITAFFAKHIDVAHIDGEYVDFEALMQIFHLDFCVSELAPIENDLFRT